MFSKIVELYRALNFPKVEGNKFSFDGAIDQSIVSLVEEVDELASHFGSFSHKEIYRLHLDAEFNLPASELGRFYQNFAEFLLFTPTLNFGGISEEFYICDIDYYSKDVTIPDVMRKLSTLCRFIRAISKLAVQNSFQIENTSRDNRLVFVVAADGKSPAKTLLIDVKVTEELLEFCLPHIKFLESLLSENRKNDVHVEERLSIMRLAIADVLNSVVGEVERFQHLVKNWGDVLSKYHHNFLAFIHQYSFEKVRKEIATTEIEHATKLSAVLGDISGKLLALPVSLAAVILLRKANSNEEFVIGFIGLACVSLIFFGILINQWLQVRRLRGSFDVIFSQYDVSKFPLKLSKPIISARRNANIQYIALVITFSFFGVLALLPLGGAIYVLNDRSQLRLSEICVLIANQLP
ncbi:hypothetical protein [Janthinobacterium svalbardensis]|uniref:hypothetical protein n=1 Tax=Janthinobacterium svalbardensis TaxID=368607 RepID=UPI002FCDC7AF